MKSVTFRRIRRARPVGAELQPRGGVHFRVWSPDHRRMEVILQPANGGPFVETPMRKTAGGYFSTFLESAAPGDRYLFRFGSHELPDPASRYQPDGPFGPSEVIDPDAFEWTDRAWKGRPLRGAVVYEMHVGTFTPEGTWRAAIDRLTHLAGLGVTAIELMPAAEFPGHFGWGYDGVFPFAPTRLYGRPEDFKAFVDRAHALGLAVLHDVVYNHFGPEGCVFRKYARAYFTRRYDNEWGDALNFDGPDSEPVREFFLANAAYWIDEFHLDGLRIDATQAIFDRSRRHVIAEVTGTVRRNGHGRTRLLISENEPQDVRMVRPLRDGGFGFDALWNDDFHHSAIVAMTGRCEAYYVDYKGTPQELVSTAKYGWLFQGQRYAWQKKSRGTPTTGVPPEAFVNFLENHDQLANGGDGSRLHRRTSPGRMRAMTALLLLLPGTPMLFQGQEFASSRPFLYFADHDGPLARDVQRGRSGFLAQFPSLASPLMQAHMPAPDDPSTFERCKLDWTEVATRAEVVALHRDLIRLRRTDAAFRRQESGALDGAVIGPEAFVLRFRGDRDADDRALIVNLGVEFSAPSLAEPLIAPPEGSWWSLRWSSEDPAYEGSGTPPVAGDEGWVIPGQAAVVLAPEVKSDGADQKQT